MKSSFCKAVAVAAMALAFAGCGGGDETSAPVGAADEVATDEVAAVRDFMLDRYLWRDRIGAADLSEAKSAEAALELLRARPIDRYSYVEPRAAADAFYDAGRTVGLGIGYAVIGDALVLRYVQPESPAAAAGLARGERIVAIDGRPVAELVASRTLDAAIGPATAGLTVVLRVARDSGPVELPVTKSAYVFRAVQAERVIDHAGRRVGYVYLSTFSEPTRDDWTQALTRLAARGAQDLLIDLRDNGGGRVGVAAALAGALAPAGTAGQPFWQVRYNARHAGANYTVPLGDNPTGVAFDRVAALTSASTCSAAEMLVFGLRPYRPIETFGQATCGKPVGFAPQPVGNDKLLNAVTFGGANRDAPADYFDGLAPRCQASDDRQRPFGDPADPLVATALAWLRDGACPTTAAAPKAVEPGANDRPIGMARAWRGPLDWIGLR